MSPLFTWKKKGPTLRQPKTPHMTSVALPSEHSPSLTYAYSHSPFPSPPITPPTPSDRKHNPSFIRRRTSESVHHPPPPQQTMHVPPIHQRPVYTHAHTLPPPAHAPSPYEHHYYHEPQRSRSRTTSQSTPAHAHDIHGNTATRLGAPVPQPGAICAEYGHDGTWIF
ncbi:hypothetical protein D9619_013133 [Psilocybe cf. subviscida]|uniref:Uncharacterized protein n=1 Tax=Psilocybe cf. subviscida TaxID=2480587 RepID=A0A8H5B650_9AGAR|nr:hypothetical protein D9619_013133 [Psilocybe cf. subviscida]